LVFLEHASRRLHIAGVTAQPTREWTTQQARNLTAELGTRLGPMRFLLRDRDGKYSPAFDAVFQAEDMHILKTAPRAPRMNAHCERVIRTLRHELCDHVLVLNEAHGPQPAVHFPVPLQPPSTAPVAKAAISCPTRRGRERLGRFKQV
jgi:hypothetical protein